MEPQPREVHIPFSTFLKAVLVVALVWAWLLLWKWLLVALIAVFLAVAIDPPVTWLTRRGVKRGLAAVLVMLVLVGSVTAFFVAAGASLADQARTVGESLQSFQQKLSDRAPEVLKRWLATGQTFDLSLTSLGSAVVGGLAGLAVAIVMAVYFLSEGRRTYLWLSAFVPPAERVRVHHAAIEARHVIAAYMRGNLLTSAIATVATLIALLVLKVPAAVFLAFLAGICNLLPVVGLLISALPAVLLGLTVSAGTGMAVLAFYLGYNAFENYYIQPKVYGRELELSDLAVIGAFLVGAELGGVLGALVALPVAAIYPVIERLWLRDSRRADLSHTHQRLEDCEDER
jgi:predicted PurR-regulated permease PerM